jgi:tetratricopeptide (TPR) repeat protein
MKWLRAEYLLKGIFLGFLLFLAAQTPTSEMLVRVVLWSAAGLGVGVVFSLMLNLRDVTQLLRKPVAFIIFVLLENPRLVYAGVLFGLAGGVLSLQLPPPGVEVPPGFIGELDFRTSLLLVCVGGGAILGYAFGEVRMIRGVVNRLVICLLVGGLLVAALWSALDEGRLPIPILGDDRKRIGALILCAIPFFYLLTFVGLAEESEIEIALLCSMLGVGVHLLGFESRIGGLLGFLVPITLYFVYATRFMNGLRVFKHVVRGHCYLRLNKIKPALQAARRAMQLDPKSELANRLMWAIHQDVDLDLAAKDDELLELLDLNRCMNRVSMLLIGVRPPNEAMLTEATKLLHLVEKQAPALMAHVEYYRAVAALHSRHNEAAANLLSHLLNPENWSKEDLHRKSILYPAWQLVLMIHPTMKAQVGEVQLPLPGRRIEAIQATERQLGEMANDPNAMQIRDRLYAEVTEQEYLEAAQAGALRDFDYALIGQRGSSLLNGAEWERGAEYLRMLAHGIPQQAPGLFLKLSEVCKQRGFEDAAERYLQRIKQTGLDLGMKAFPPDQKEIYFNVVKQLADRAAAGQNWDEAIQDYSIYTQFEGSGKETLRKLAEMYAGKKELIEAVRVLEKAILYGTDKDLQEKKDSYYYSVLPEALQPVREQVKGYFDIGYCVKKSRSLIETRSDNLDLLDWAEHLVTLALVMEPKNLVANVVRARCHLRRGESDGALKLLEDVREMKPSGNDESDAWYFAVRQLGLLYLERFSRPDLAIECFKTYQDSIKAGADTHYDLGRCYEALNDIPNAVKHYQYVTGFEEHPRRWDAEEAIRRLKAGQAV